MDKKGFMVDFLADFYSFLAYLLILILFFVLFSLSIEGCESPEAAQVVSGYNDEISEEMMLLNYLRTEIRGLPMVEMIANASINDKWRSISAHTGIIFDEMDMIMYGELRCSVICINDGDDRIMEMETSGCENYIYGKVCRYNVTIPLYYSEPVKTLTIGLSHDMYTTKYKVPSYVPR